MTTITQLDLWNGWSPVLNDQVLEHILFRPNLEMLLLSPDLILDAEMIRRVSPEGSINRIFPSLRVLDTAMDLKALRLMSSVLQHLQGIHFTIDELPASLPSEDHILRYLVAGCQLEEIEFISGHPTTVPSDVLLGLAFNCPELRCLDLSESSCQCDANFTDALMEILASRCVNLQTLDLPFGTGLTIQSLLSLGRHCPNLQSLSLRTSIDMVLLRDESDLHFSSLQILRLSAIRTTRISSDTDLVETRDKILELWERSFPALQHIDFTTARADLKGTNLRTMLQQHLAEKRSLQPSEDLVMVGLRQTLTQRAAMSCTKLLQ